MNDAVSNAEHAWVREHASAFVDGELSAPNAARVRAHLERCVHCRRDIRTQRSLKQRLRELRLDRDQACRLRELPGRAPAARPTRRHMLAYCVWAALALLPLTWFARERLRSDPRLTEAAPVPIAHDAVADYRKRVVHGLPQPGLDLATRPRRMDLPDRALGQLGPLAQLAQVARLAEPGAVLVAAWTTELRGMPAAALAYRFRSRTVIQYVVSEELFFQPGAVRKSVHRHGRYMTHEGPHSVVAWPVSGAGVWLVGDLPIQELERLRGPG